MRRMHGAVLACALMIVGAACSDDELRASLRSPARGSGAGELCGDLARIATLWGVDPLGPEMTSALAGAIEHSPAEVASALETLRDDIWRTPEETAVRDHDAVFVAQRTVDTFAARTCGVAVFDVRITRENPTLPDPEDVEQTDLGPDYLPDRPMLRTQAGGQRVVWEMPRVNLIDGPRPLRNIADPATGTFWAYGGHGVEVRYDATLLTDLGHLGANDDEIVRAALTQLNGGTVVEFGPSARANGRLEIDFLEQYDDRVYMGRAYSWSGNVFSVSVAVPWNREDLGDAAERELIRLDRSVRFEPL